ncbi:hypothetical protein HY993_03540 [Candidatus Micrarchaeota archaeon]|nr:hypothetical protein [Candidatus Micrarchaeota archaeon]
MPVPAAAQQVLPKLFNCVKYEKGETLHVIQGEESIKLLVDSRNLQKILDLIPKNLVIGVQKNLAEINLHLHPLAVKTPGIVYVICGELFRNNVNVYEVTSCVPEMLFFVEEKDLLKAHQVVFELCHAK